MKVKAIVSLLALAGAFGAANATVNTSQGNAEIFFSAYNTAETKSYLYDTGLNVSSLIDGTINASINLGTDSNWTSFVSSVGGVANINWSVEALQFQNGVNTKFLYATLGAGASVGAIGLNSTFATPTTLLNNLLQTTTAAAGTSEVAPTGTPTYIGSDFDKFAPATVSKLSNAVGVTGVSFFGAANSNTSKGTLKGTLLATPTALAGFTSDGTLTISAVPEPSSFVLALTALAGVGFVARRRRAK